jgi:hypothetical protein
MMHDFHPNHLLPANPSQTENATPTPEKPTKTMTPAALDANRANAAKSTGPRTEAGKARSASNSFKHGLYSLRNFQAFYMNNNLAQTVMVNFHAQFEPVTPTEYTLFHQLVHFQLRFLYMEHLYGLLMNHRSPNPLSDPDSLFLAIHRELDRLSTRVHRAIKLLREEIAQRKREASEIEPIPDPEPLPTCPNPDDCVASFYHANSTEAGRLLHEREILPLLQSIREEALAHHKHCNKPTAESGTVPGEPVR